VDDDIDPTNPVAVEYAISTRCQADRDLVIIPNAKGSSLDPSSDQHNLLTTKLGIDATATLLKAKDRFEIAKIPGETTINLSDYVSDGSGIERLKKASKTKKYPIRRTD
jgi:3-polyprenyl-4-hydroxybenzoate decarboxylase